ncbi:MAG: DNA-directed RNA polymerase subunit alpha C-terminal domain-containing protein, partial [Planctomycetota bacterium]
NPFVQYGFVGGELAAEPKEESTLPEPPETSTKVLQLKERLALPISDLDLSVRASNCLEAENVRTVGDLVRLSEADLLAMKNFGKTSLREVKQKLANHGLSLEMDVEALVGSGGE